MSANLRVGMGQPYFLRLRMLATSEFDPTAVTGATIKITKPVVGGESVEVEWAATIENKTAEGVSALYNFAVDGSDLDVAGRWRAWVQWTVPSQEPGPRSEVTAFSVADRNAA